MLHVNEILNKKLRRNKCYSESSFVSVPVSRSNGYLTILENTGYSSYCTYTPDCPESLKLVIDGKPKKSSSFESRFVVGLSPLLQRVSKLSKSKEYQGKKLRLRVYFYKKKPTHKRYYISQYYVEVVDNEKNN